MQRTEPLIHRTALIFTVVAFLTTVVNGIAQADYRDHRSFGEVEGRVELAFSTQADRSEAHPLDGAGAPLGGRIAVFLGGASSYSNARFIRRVEFVVNGERINREYRPPYDLGGTRPGGRANLIPTDSFEVGPNEIVAKVHLRSGKRFEVEGTLNVLPASPSIVELAAGNPDFSHLVEAIVAADLLDFLSGPGPFTVFAPTNEAFDKLLMDLGISKAALLANELLLREVLTYHVLPKALFAEAVLARDQLIPFQGEPIAVDAENGRVNDSNLTSTDNAASNGVVHVIDEVMLPPSLQPPPGTIAEIAASNPDFSILVEALVEVGLDGVLSVEGTQITAFAPTNDAFVALLGALDITKEQLFANRPLLTTVLLYHLVSEEIFAEDVLDTRTIIPMESEPIVVNAAEGKLNDSTLIAIDIDASNGVIHVIDTVLVPPAALQLLAE